MARLDFRVQPGGSLNGAARVPGDKSISHRAVMLGALADGRTAVSGLLEGEDVLRTVAAFRQMGVGIEGPSGGRATIEGVGLYGLCAPNRPLDMGNSGTATRLMAGILAAQSFDSMLIGDASLMRRPMQRVVEPLSAMGASIAAAQGGRPPLRIAGGKALRGIDYRLPVPSAQVKSSILLAGLYADGETAVTEPVPTRDHTERMLRAFGYDVIVTGATARLRGGGRLRATVLAVPADISSAAFFLVGASVAPNSQLLLPDVGVNPTRTGVINILRLMGADIDVINLRTVGDEPIGDLRVSSRRLRGIRIPREQVPLAIDELPAILIAAACAEGETVLTGAEELRVKESDRIAAMAAGLKGVGIDVRETPDGMIVRGGQVRGGVVDSLGDHRIAMAFAMAGLVAQGSITVHDCKNVDTSFPGFAGLARSAGLPIETIEANP
ncbi:MAG TPA: 3-phosphoshikimate 1-carboxyvinyltransferase [Burkholderiales bacterium]